MQSKMVNGSFENVIELKYLGKTVTNQTLIHAEIMRLNSGNACYLSLWNLLSCLLSKNIKTQN
jgi:hypothetical protein